MNGSSWRGDRCMNLRFYYSTLFGKGFHEVRGLYRRCVGS